MKRCLLVSFFCMIRFCLPAQKGNCDENAVAATGDWKQAVASKNLGSAAAGNGRQFLEAIHKMFQPYKPSVLQARPFLSIVPVGNGRPANILSYTIMAHEYYCSSVDNRLTMADETATSLNVSINAFYETELYDTSKDDYLTGFFELRHGLPVEVKPGIWQFPLDDVSIGFGNSGKSDIWLFTFDGELPFAYVTRKEFLLKRRANLQNMIPRQAILLKEQLEKWETEKKYKLEELKNDPAKLANYLDNTHKPAIERENKNYKDALQELEQALQHVNEQLTKPGLDKQAIVIKNRQKLYDYEFTDKVEPFAQVLTKPNPAYFRRRLPPSIPQFITVELVYDHQDPVYLRFAENIKPLVNTDYFKSLIGKPAPGASAPVADVGRSATTTTATPAASNAPAKAQAVSKAENKTPGSTKLAISPATDSKSSTNPALLSGLLSAPGGTQATLKSIGNEVAVTIPKDRKLLYTTVPFSFAKPLQKNAPYEVQVKSIPSNLKAIVYNGKGEFQPGSNKIKVAADYQYELLTRSSDDKVLSTFYQSGDVAVGGYKGEEGRYVAFISLTQGIEGSSGKFRQVFWRDRNTGTTKLISASSTSAEGNGDSYLPSLSADGQLVVFESNASNLVDGDNNNAKDIFLWNAATNKIELISKSSSGGFADAESMDASISGNGQYVVFTSTAGNLSSISKGQSITNVFVRDLQAGKTEMISVDPLKLSGANGGKGSISFNGEYASFCSPTNGLVPGDNNGLWDIFLWQKGHKGLKRVSLTSEGREHDQGQESATRMIASSISGNGRYVAYATTSGNIVPNDHNNLQDVFVCDTETGKVIIASQTDEGKSSDGDSPIEQGERVAISYDGTWIAFPTKATNLGTPGSNIVLHNMVTGKKQIVTSTRGSYVGRPAISYSGSYIVFGKSEAMDNRFSASGLFAHFTGNGPCRDCKD